MSSKPLRVPNTGNPFRTGKADGRTLTSEQIAEHVAAFRRAGGTVEVLGTTRTLSRIGTVAPAGGEAPTRKK